MRMGIWRGTAMAFIRWQEGVMENHKPGVVRPAGLLKSQMLEHSNSTIIA
jgi:hypothetical protein